MEDESGHDGRAISIRMKCRTGSACGIRHEASSLDHIGVGVPWRLVFSFRIASIRRMTFGASFPMDLARDSTCAMLAPPTSQGASMPASS